MSRISDFIRENAEEILAAWETFARGLPSTEPMDIAPMREHAAVMLTIIARDLDVPQSELQRNERPDGSRDAQGSDAMSAAARYGLGRAEGGLTVTSLLAEFRALRTSVISLWRRKHERAGPDELEEMTRFNEAVDQAIAEAVTRYLREVDATRDRFFAVLGHDLRTPLGVITTSSQFLLETGKLDEDQRRLIAGMQRSGRRMIELVRDLLDLALTRLGNGIPVKPAEADMGDIVRGVVAETTASGSGKRIEIETSGSLVGRWDRPRVAQALGNLISNAVQHGLDSAPIKVVARGDDAETVTVSVANQGTPIPPDQIHGIFAAMKGDTGNGNRGHLGLGLYIVDKIVDAHGGRIDVSSSAPEGTKFTVSLPRNSSL